MNVGRPAAIGGGTPILPLWRVPPARRGDESRAFVDFQNDNTVADIQLAVREGYHSVEHVKRYTALGFGTDQGKTGNINGMAILAETLGQSIPATGTTTFRPAWTPVAFGAIAGSEHGALFDPVRLTPMHEGHLAAGARFEVVGQWHRAWYYPRAGETLEQAVDRECRAVRAGVGLLDYCTLGKIDIRGADAAEFLERVYTNSWKKLGLMRCRYGLMLGEDGMIFDDGVTTRLAEDRFFMTTTTGGAARVLSHLERWHQTEWPTLEVRFTSVTDQWSTAVLAGPQSRVLLQSLCSDIDLSREAFPFLAAREGHVAGIPARVLRVSFSGELSFEIMVGASHGLALWNALMQAGQEHGITPYGTESMHVLRAEKGFIIVGQDTDGSMTPADMGMEWIVDRKKKLFIGDRSLERAYCHDPQRKQFVGLLTDDPAIVIPEGSQLLDQPSHAIPARMIGHVSSSYASSAAGRSIALALVKGGHARSGERVYAALADGRMVSATLCKPMFYDPAGERQNV